MAEDPTPPPAPIDRIEDLAIEQELQDSYLTYAMSTIMDRALPDVRDGLKPSQRRILVAMRDLNLGPRSKHLKCAKICGNTSGDYHPHGEAIIYPTLVRLAQEWSLRYPLIDGQGNFGSTHCDPPAAMRYTAGGMAAPAEGRAGDGTAGGHGAGHRRSDPELRRDADGANRSAQQVPQPAGERVNRN